MLFLFGIRRKAKTLGQVDKACSKCGRQTVHSAIEAQRWFTLFFVPVVPLGSSYVVRCNLCGLTLKSSAEVKGQLASRAMAARA